MEILEKLYDDYIFTGRPLTSNELVALSFGLFIGGFETSSNTLSFALYYLAKHQMYQDKARDEINTVLGRHNNQITYEAMQELTYLQQCIDGKFGSILGLCK